LAIFEIVHRYLVRVATIHHVLNFLFVPGLDNYVFPTVEVARNTDIKFLLHFHFFLSLHSIWCFIRTAPDAFPAALGDDGLRTPRWTKQELQHSSGGRPAGVRSMSGTSAPTCLYLVQSVASPRRSSSTILHSASAGSLAW